MQLSFRDSEELAEVEAELVGIFQHFVVLFMECSSNNLLLSCAQFQDAAFKSNKGESKNKSEVSTQVICSFSFVDQIL